MFCCVGLGRAISKALSSAGAVVYALDKFQENLDSLVAEVIQLIIVFDWLIPPCKLQPLYNATVHEAVIGR